MVISLNSSLFQFPNKVSPISLPEETDRDHLYILRISLWKGFIRDVYRAKIPFMTICLLERLHTKSKRLIVLSVLA